MLTVKDQLEQYLRSLPKDAPKVQREEMTKAFLCGYLCCFSFCCYQVASLPDEAAEIKMSEIELEVHQLLGISPPLQPQSGN